MWIVLLLKQKTQDARKRSKNAFENDQENAAEDAFKTQPKT
jgi:hypothetical protein